MRGKARKQSQRRAGCASPLAAGDRALSRLLSQPSTAGAPPSHIEKLTLEIDEFRSVVIQVHTEQRYSRITQPHLRPASIGEFLLALGILAPSLSLSTEGGRV